MLPFGTSTAAAAFRHGDEAWVVFDERRPLDLGSLTDDAAPPGASVEVLPSATVLRLKLALIDQVRLERKADGWLVIVSAAMASSVATMPVSRPSRLLVPVSAPGQVVAVPDLETGRNLLVGTLRTGGPGVPVDVRVPEFSVLRSWQGVVVEPVSDRMTVRAVPEGFAIESGAAMSALPAHGPTLATAAMLTRRFDIPTEPVGTLLRRLQVQVQAEGNAPPLARLEPRKAAAATMLALGLGAEAQSLLRLAVSEDPRAAADPEIAGLTGIAALMSGRPQEAEGLEAPLLAGSDEVSLWRAVRAAMIKEDSPEAAHVFAASGAMVLSYPSALRNRLLPIVAETMALGGADVAADGLLAQVPDEPLLAMARAIRLEQKGSTDAALTLYDALASGRDRLAGARAATRATLLRFASGAIGSSDAAVALERGFEAWRGDVRERDLRLRAVGVLAQSQQWRKAFDTLKETAQLFPADRSQIAARTTALMGELLHGPAATSIKPVDLVALAGENADAVAQADAGGMALLLADKLTALDLPRRAVPVLQRMADAAPAGPGRAGLGARLAAVLLGEGDLAGAGAALAKTAAADLPPGLQEERCLLDARIHARNHDIAGAASILSGSATSAAGELRATILGESGDWHGAAVALDSVASRALPETGPLTQDQQELLVRLASAYARAGDEGPLQALGRKQTARMAGPHRGLFDLLTTAPVTGVGDLRRNAGDITLARTLPSAINAIAAR